MATKEFKEKKRTQEIRRSIEKTDPNFETKLESTENKFESKTKDLKNLLEEKRKIREANLRIVKVQK